MKFASQIWGSGLRPSTCTHAPLAHARSWEKQEIAGSLRSLISFLFFPLLFSRFIVSSNINARPRVYARIFSNLVKKISEANFLTKFRKYSRTRVSVRTYTYAHARGPYGIFFAPQKRYHHFELFLVVIVWGSVFEFVHILGVILVILPYFWWHVFFLLPYFWACFPSFTSEACKRGAPRGDPFGEFYSP